MDIVPAPCEPCQRARGATKTYEQRTQADRERRVREAQIEEDIEGWYNDSLSFAADLSRRFGRTADHYMRMMFASPTKLHGVQRKPNVFNAWVHHLAKEGGDNMNTAQLAETYRDDYEALSAEQKAEYVEELLHQRESENYGLRTNQRSRTMDVKHVSSVVENMLLGLHQRTGIQVFLCITRGMPDFQMQPHWYWTDQSIEDYLQNAVRGFDPVKIGVLVEAFSIAGADYLTQMRNGKDKVAYLKGEIRMLIARALCDITGDDDAAMSYTQYTRDVQLRHRVTMQGWTHHQWANPSKLSNSLAPLQKLRNVLKSRECRFVQLTDEQYNAIKEQYNKEAQDGTRPSRKKRKDAGVRRGAKDREGPAASSSRAEAAPSKKRCRGSVTSSDESTSNPCPSDGE
ncbi:hypothetical protein C8Q77DRAFT_1071019 [Trametes polyzona]|nr:hypothetical protein C8Q77DRAFT_1071019 [Trametes polyzona]